MPTFKHILFPVDFSDRCKAICPFVVTMAERFGSRLTLMHVIETPIGWYGGIEAAYPAMFDVPAMTKEVCEKLDKFFDPPKSTVKIET